MQHRGRQIGADANLAAWQHGQPVDPGPQPRPAVLSIPDPALTRRGRLDEALRVAIGEGEAADRAARMDLGHAGAVDMDLAGRRLGADPDPPGGGHHQLVGAGPQPGRAALGIPDPALARGRTLDEALRVAVGEREAAARAARVIPVSPGPSTWIMR